MSKACSVAKEFIKLSLTGDESEPLTQLRLQKLLYYSQAWSLVIRKSELFPEAIEAWRQGPVVPLIYRGLPEGLGKSPIELASFDNVPDLGKDESEFVAEVWNSYREFSAWGLGNKTHAEEPYLKAWGDSPTKTHGNTEIDIDSLEEFFAKQTMPAPLAAFEHKLQKAEISASEAVSQFGSFDQERLSAIAKEWTAPLLNEFPPAHFVAS